MMATYDELYKSVQAQVDDLKKKANQLAAKEKKIINDQYDAAIKLQEDAVAEQQAAAEKQYNALYDANVVNEMVARKNAEEAIANMGLKDSGLNQTNQTAISISRGEADNSVRLQKQAAIDSLSAALAQYKAESDIQRASAIASVELENAQTLADIDSQATKTLTQSSQFDQDRYDSNLKYVTDFNANPNNNRYGYELQVDSVGNIITVPTVVTTKEDGITALENSQIVLGNTTGERNNRIELFALYGNQSAETKRNVIRNSLLAQGGYSSMTDDELYDLIANTYSNEVAAAILDALELDPPAKLFVPQSVPWGNSSGTTYTPDGKMILSLYPTIGG